MNEEIGAMRVTVLFTSADCRADPVFSGRVQAGLAAGVSHPNV